MYYGLMTECGAARCVLKAFATELPCAVLVNRHEGSGKLTVLKQAIHVAIESMED